MLHSQTTLILAAMLFLLLPVVVWLALRSASDPAVTWWCSGGMLAGLGIVLQNQPLLKSGGTSQAGGGLCLTTLPGEGARVEMLLPLAYIRSA